MSGIAVITGDLIASTQVAEPARFRARLSDLLAMASEKYAAITNLYRGDGFQIAMDSSANAFEAAILMRSGLIAGSTDSSNRWDARIAIAFGAGPLSESDQNSEAYVNSGRALDNMGKQHLCVHGGSEALDLGLRAATLFADDVMDGLTPTEAEVLFYYFLHRESHQRIADRLGKKRPTITVALQRAKYTLLDQYIADMNELVSGNNV